MTRGTVAYLDDEWAHRQKIEAIKAQIEAYIKGNPTREIFTFFISCNEDIPAIRHAAAAISIAAGKVITIGYPASNEQEEGGTSC